MQAQDAGELSFKVGDIVVVSNQDDSGYLLNDDLSVHRLPIIDHGLFAFQMVERYCTWQNRGFPRCGHVCMLLCVV